MYKKEFRLQNHEAPAKINKENGDITELNGAPKKDSRNVNRVWFDNQMRFKRYFDASPIISNSLTTLSQETKSCKRFSILSNLLDTFSIFKKAI